MAVEWAGDFTCFECRRKRLTASAFSKSMVNKRLKNPDAKIKCKECVQKEAEAERAAAVARSASEVYSSDIPEFYICTKCEKTLPTYNFSRGQLSKKKSGNQRCKNCIDKAQQKERDSAAQKSLERLEDARKISEATGSSKTLDALAALSVETATEAELVTGLKPVTLGRGRGRRGRGRGARGSW
eukprot:UC4_evm7s1221